MTSNISAHLGLRAGDWVVIRSKEEILSTLDDNARLDSLPFHPEMFEFCGQKIQVSKTGHKTCDTIKKTGGRRMHNAVHLGNLRCNGSAHGDCQADCLFYWKESWLKRVSDTSTPSTFSENTACTEERVQRATQDLNSEPNVDDPTWSCQNTSLYDASEPLAWWDVRQYIKDVTSGNHTIWHMIKILTAGGYRSLVQLGYGYGLLIKFYNAFQKLRGGKPFPIGSGNIVVGEPTPTEVLDLQPGEWVEVKSPDELRSTLNQQGFNRGMRFDMEMLKYAGERYKVEMRVDLLINEETGKMMKMKTPCIQLEDVFCRAECTMWRLGCPRASSTYWREIWLKRVDGPEEGR